MGSLQDDRPAAPDQAGSDEGGRTLLDELERRVLLLIKEFEALREARRQAEPDSLREQIRTRDAQIAQLTEQLELERRRAGEARERLKALVRRIDGLEAGR